MDNLDEMDKFLETQNLQRLYHEETDNLNRPINSKEIEWEIKNLPTKKSPEPACFIDEFYQTHKKELIPILLKCFQKIKERILPNTVRPALT